MSLALALALLTATTAIAESQAETAGAVSQHVRSPARTAAPRPTATPAGPAAQVSGAQFVAPSSAPAMPPPGVVLPVQPLAAAAPAPVAAAIVVGRPPVPPQPAVVFGAPSPLVDWRPLDAENTLVIDTDRGRIVIELRPEFAPAAVARIKRLARRGVYDGLQFHRVIDGFMAQTGDPNNMDGGKSLEPDLPSEFTFRLGAEVPRTLVARPQGETEGFIGAQPYVSVDEIRMAVSPDRRVSAWAAYCSGVVGMGHDSDPESGNSEFFIMRAATRSLDRHYSPVGRVILGLDVVRALAVGDPPTLPDRMRRVRVLADLPDPERPAISVLNTLSPEFRAIADQVRTAKGADFSICDVEVPVRIDAPVLGRLAEAPAKAKGRRRRRPPSSS